MENEPNQIVEVDNQQPQAVMELEPAGTALTEAEIQEIELKVQSQNRIKQILLKATRKHHWNLMGETPYLNDKGCKAVASALGLGQDYGEPEESRHEDEEGSYYMYTTKVVIKFRGISVSELGIGTSRDDFFSMAHGKRKPQSEINKASIIKKSVTNGFNRGIKRLLGIDFSLEEVEAAVGSLNSASSVNYRSATKAEETGADAKLRADLKAKIAEMFDRDVERCKAYCAEISAFTSKDGKEVAGSPDFSKWSIGRVKANQKRIESDFDSFKKGA